MWFGAGDTPGAKTTLEACENTALGVAITDYVRIRLLLIRQRARSFFDYLPLEIKGSLLSRSRRLLLDDGVKG